MVAFPHSQSFLQGPFNSYQTSGWEEANMEVWYPLSLSLSLSVSPFQKFKDQDLKREGIRAEWHARGVLGDCGYAQHLAFFLNGAWERRDITDA